MATLAPLIMIAVFATVIGTGCILCAARPALLTRLQSLDRRYIYSILMLVVAIPFLAPFSIPVTVSPPTRMLYSAIEQLQPGDFVLLGMDWAAGTRGENRPQSQAIVRHLMQRHVRIAILSFEPQGPALAQRMMLAAAPEYHYVEGTDWANFGYRADAENYLKGFGINVPGSLVADMHGTAAASLPILHGIASAADIKFVMDVTPTDTYNFYIKYIQGPYHVREGVALTAIMSPEAYNRIDSHQIVGMMPGLTGAVEYEQLLHMSGPATRDSASLSASHLLIIALIVFGNLAMIAERRLKRKGAAAS